MTDTVVIEGEVSLLTEVDGEVHLLAEVEGEAGIVVDVGSYAIYDGPYSVTPGPEAQTLETANLAMAENITVAPIPSNYGLITWNGSYLTVS